VPRYWGRLDHPLGRNEKEKNLQFLRKKYISNKKITAAIAVSAYILDTIPHKTTKCARLAHNTLAYRYI
jgi:hypothetical protein